MRRPLKLLLWWLLRPCPPPHRRGHAECVKRGPQHSAREQHGPVARVLDEHDEGAVEHEGRRARRLHAQGGGHDDRCGRRLGALFVDDDHRFVEHVRQKQLVAHGREARRRDGRVERGRQAERLEGGFQRVHAELEAEAREEHVAPRARGGGPHAPEVGLQRAGRQQQEEGGANQLDAKENYSIWRGLIS